MRTGKVPKNEILKTSDWNRTDTTKSKNKSLQTERKKAPKNKRTARSAEEKVPKKQQKLSCPKTPLNSFLNGGFFYAKILLKTLSLNHCKKVNGLYKIRYFRARL